ncbi:MAG TPA: hypothetical protein VFA82_03055 [Gaiellaceae bacterium]|nr:hypothetical protein [Gaiellaceae bacterium]
MLTLLDRDEIRRLLPPIAEQIEIVERVYRALAGGRVELPPKIGVHPRADAFLHAMPAYLEEEDVVAIKWVSGYPDNPSRGLPYISGVIVVNDAATGIPTAILDAAEITAARTAAASGACIEAFAPAGWRRAAVLGAGEQGRYHVRLLRAIAPECEIAVFDPVTERAANAGDGAVAAATPRDAVEGAEVVVTAAPIVRDPRPAVEADWLAPRCLLLPLDFDASVTADAVAACEVHATDDVAQYDSYRTQGHFERWPRPDRSVGVALDDVRPAARVCCTNLGVGALDAAFAAAVLERFGL